MGAVGQLYPALTLDYEDVRHREGFKFMVQVTDRVSGGGGDDGGGGGGGDGVNDVYIFSSFYFVLSYIESNIHTHTHTYTHTYIHTHQNKWTSLNTFVCKYMCLNARG